MHKRVVVTGLGCISPVGSTTQATWQALLAGESGIAPITLFDASLHKTKFAGEVKGFDAVALLGMREARKMDRFTQLAVVATDEALQDSGLKIDESNRDRVGIVIGSGIGGIGTIMQELDAYRERGPDRVSPFLIPMMITDGAAGVIAIRTGARGPNMSISTACATGTNTLGEAFEMIRRGAADIMIAGGAEATIVPVVMAGLNVMGALTTFSGDPKRACRPFDLNRNGFVLSEGAAVLVLESLESAQTRGAKIICEFSGYGTSDDAHHISAPVENGAGAILSMQAALDNAGLSVRDIGYINAHGTSTQLNDKGETMAIKSVFGEHAYNIPISSTKSMTGHLLGAAGSLEALVCAKVLTDNIIPPTINYETPDPICDLDYVPNQARAGQPRHALSNSFGFGGHNATVILSRFEA